ncbi:MULTISPECIES: signal peptidase II [Sphingomonas]|uniref:Lipoprotein signal peptidase n=1 Tax=Sphingomonas yabuuchiae TaxID=172044 RepID=A0AA40ZVZ9_9SPHN|nr:signal peptidase II [Sphingomonas sp. S17]MBN3557013.1 signal peptidase II [Sphingomonas yabuuchiae]
MLNSGSSKRPNRQTRPHLAALLVAVAALGVDQTTKPLAHAYVEQNGPLEITSFLTMTSGWNTGVAFGVAAFANPTILVAVGLALSAVLVVFLVKTESTFEKIALGMAIGGALANVVDRLRFGAVRDFIDVHLNDWHWPAFNFADVFIVLGLFSLLFAGREQRRAAAERQSRN